MTPSPAPASALTPAQSDAGDDALWLAHVSDLHVLDLHGTPATALLGKRLTGLANLVGPRRGAHPRWLAEALVTRLRSDDIDHVAFTGDLTNLSLASEFERGVALLERVGDGARLSAVPGNHDAYARDATQSARGERAIARWAAGAASREAYPWVKAPRPWLRLYGLSSAIAAPPLFAWGEVGAAQRQRLAELVAAEPAEVRVRVALVHHNLHPRRPPTEWTSALRDRVPLAAALLALGFDAVLHGHTHAPHRGHLVGADGRRCLVLGCGSSTWHRPDHGQLAHLNRMRLSAAGVDRVIAEVWDDTARAFVAEAGDVLAAARARRVDP